jgi:hypothetical protein
MVSDEDVHALIATIEQAGDTLAANVRAPRAVAEGSLAR